MSMKVLKLVRNCPECGRELSCGSKYYLLRALKTKLRCKSCARKNSPKCMTQAREAIKKAAESLRGKPSWSKGVIRSAEHCRRLSEAHKGKRHTEEHKAKIAQAMKGKPGPMEGKRHTEETKAKMSVARKGRKLGPKSEETKRKISLAQKGKVIPKEVREKTSKTMRKLLATTDLLQRRMSNIRRNCKGGTRECPNKQEAQLNGVLEALFPSEYKFVGDGSITIDGLNPDFVNVNGQKKIIELFGEVYHDPKACRWKVRERSTEAERKKVFRKYGYKTLVVWCKELSNTEKLKSKLSRFHKSQNIGAQYFGSDQ